MALYMSYRGYHHFLFFRIREDHVIQHGLVVDGTSLSLASEPQEVVVKFE